MKRLSLIIDLLQNKNFEISKTLENPTIVISNARPILSFPRSDITCSCNFELRAKHKNRALNEKALIEIHKLLGEDSSFIMKNLSELDSDIDIFSIQYRAYQCLKR